MNKVLIGFLIFKTEKDAFSKARGGEEKNLFPTKGGKNLKVEGWGCVPIGKLIADLLTLLPASVVS